MPPRFEPGWSGRPGERTLDLGGISVADLVAPDRPPPPRWLERAIERIRARIDGSLGLGALAREAGVHPVYFARVFRAHTGQAPGAYVRRLRVDRAAALLAGSRRSIGEIAIETGFADQSHLTRTFRAVLGVTPAAYRRARER